MQRGRKSAAQLAVVDVSGAPPRLKTPTGLNAAERALFEEIVASTDPRHFRVSDTSMLISFVQAALMARKLARNPKKIVDWEKVARAMTLLATRLRLTPHARSDPKVIGRMEPSTLRKPWDTKPWDREER